MPAWIGSPSVGVPFANRLTVGRRRKREGDQLRLWDNIRCLIAMCLIAMCLIAMCLIAMCLITTASDLVLGCSVVPTQAKGGLFRRRLLGGWTKVDQGCLQRSAN